MGEKEIKKFINENEFSFWYIKKAERENIGPELLTETILNDGFANLIRIPTVLALAAMKAFSPGGRAKWKDYVDLYFLLKNHFNLKDLSTWARQLFGNEFNEKLLREQLAYNEDIDYTEPIDFINQEISHNKIKHFLTASALKSF